MGLKQSCRIRRCRIVLSSSDGVGTMGIVRATGKSKKCVRRRQGRFMAEGVDGLLREKSRPPGTLVTPDERTVEVIRPAPHRRRVFKFSRDPAFVEKPHDIVGLYVSPPAHAVVLSVDEKSEIQAPDRTQPGRELEAWRHDYNHFRPHSSLRNKTPAGIGAGSTGKPCRGHAPDTVVAITPCVGHQNGHRL